MAILLSEVKDNHDMPDLGIIRIDRTRLYKRRWRAEAECGTEVAVALDEPAKHDQVLVGKERSFKVQQIPEKVVIIPIPEDPSFAAKIGWYLGNRHIPIEVREAVMLMEYFENLITSLERIGIEHSIGEDILRCKPHSEHMH